MCNQVRFGIEKICIASGIPKAGVVISLIAKDIVLNHSVESIPVFVWDHIQYLVVTARSKEFVNEEGIPEIQTDARTFSLIIRN